MRSWGSLICDKWDSDFYSLLHYFSLILSLSLSACVGLTETTEGYPSPSLWVAIMSHDFPPSVKECKEKEEREKGKEECRVIKFN